MYNDLDVATSKASLSVATSKQKAVDTLEVKADHKRKSDEQMLRNQRAIQNHQEFRFHPDSNQQYPFLQENRVRTFTCFCNGIGLSLV